LYVFKIDAKLMFLVSRVYSSSNIFGLNSGSGTEKSQLTKGSLFFPKSLMFTNWVYRD